MIKILSPGLVLLLLVVVGCNRKVVPSSTTEVTDSTTVKYVPRLVEVQIPGETVTLTRYIECDSVTNKPKATEFTATSGRAKVKVEIKDTGELIATGGCDSLKKVIELMDKELFRYRHEKKTEVRTIYQTRRIDKYLRWLFVGEVFLLIALVFYKLNRLQP